MIRRSLPLAAVAALVIATGAFADSDPRAFVNELGNEAIQVMGPRVSFEQRVARFAQLFQADFAVQQIGQFVMGRIPAPPRRKNGRHSCRRSRNRSPRLMPNGLATMPAIRSA